MVRFTVAFATSTGNAELAKKSAVDAVVNFRTSNLMCSHIWSGVLHSVATRVLNLSPQAVAQLSFNLILWYHFSAFHHICFISFLFTRYVHDEVSGSSAFAAYPAISPREPWQLVCFRVLLWNFLREDERRFREKLMRTRIEPLGSLNQSDAVVGSWVLFSVRVRDAEAERWRSSRHQWSEHLKSEEIWNEVKKMKKWRDMKRYLKNFEEGCCQWLWHVLLTCIQCMSCESQSEIVTQHSGLRSSGAAAQRCSLLGSGWVVSARECKWFRSMMEHVSKVHITCTV